jgi:hypothetical protein
VASSSSSCGRRRCASCASIGHLSLQLLGIGCRCHQLSAHMPWFSRSCSSRKRGGKARSHQGVGWLHPHRRGPCHFLVSHTLRDGISVDLQRLLRRRSPSRPSPSDAASREGAALITPPINDPSAVGQEPHPCDQRDASFSAPRRSCAMVQSACHRSGRRQVLQGGKACTIDDNAPSDITIDGPYSGAAGE